MKRNTKGRKNKFLIKPEPIVLAKSFLCLNAVFGCRNGCAYCYKHNWSIDNKFVPQQLFSIKDILKNLTDFPYYSSSIPLAIHNSTTDPFQSGVKEVTFEMLAGLEKRKINNIVSLITKEYLTKSDLRYLESFRYIRPIVFVTYSGLSKKIENIVKDKRLNLMRNLKDTKLKKVLYFRPIIKGMNDSKRNIVRIMRLGERYFDCIVRSPIKLDINIIEHMAKKGIFVNPKYDIGLNIHDSLKRMLPETRKKVNEELSKAKIPVFKKTSCAISWAFKQPDYNTHWIRRNIYCTANCPFEQKERCKEAASKKIDRNKFDKQLKKIGKESSFKRNGEFISVSGKDFSYSDIKFLRMAVNFPVMIEKNGEYLTAEELDTKYHNADRREVRRFLREEMKIDGY